MPSRTPPPPRNLPANEALRRPEPRVIDQRQQQIDPAGHHRTDVNANATGTMKQPGAGDQDPAQNQPGQPGKKPAAREPGPSRKG